MLPIWLGFRAQSSLKKGPYLQIFHKHGRVWLKIRQKLFKMDSYLQKLIIKLGKKGSFELGTKGSFGNQK